ncbi:preprotein translocase subunit SecE [Francisella adeliensis]|uniref:Protein translocase subunit SecE n=1 Tax=Francisella adeliensis TaxID=2007306 RepID=A0A2Z4XX14_9GAMM|nr:preprotein translocase subunit SecE [Francisella adeliensis]AXA33256.1 preprotein translocase subunit SecE [Francisella adeliensis]MBK2085022.1 preprotein translocase subunit SecE [Francisella adeliensis]MBK2096987.1 preprotein translocase subunit SecE [Francisella adeliensis]QIW11482.1 preprotein translocase subunit SecE [Francisella adeliensis]QIW13357.1 preprotein translocase subunit SecE [Francisella adeliensis]
MKKSQNINDKVWVSGATKPTELSTISKGANTFLWLITMAIVVFGVAITMYSEVLGLNLGAYNTSIAVVVVLVSLVVARFTNQGRRFWSFFNASKLELAKVVWPTRRETMTISAMVIVVVIIFAILISIFGMIFENFIQYFLG